MEIGKDKTENLVYSMFLGIEAQEKDGQSELMVSNELPRSVNQYQFERDADISNPDSLVRKGMEDLGFIFGKVVDDLFISATLPKGWTKLATEHSMWSELIDEKERVRASIFYKAAFYDRSTHMNFNRAFDVESDYYSIDIPNGEKRTIRCWIQNNVTGERLHETEFLKFGYEIEGGDFTREEWIANCNIYDELTRELWKKIEELFPENNNPFAYWS